MKLTLNYNKTLCTLALLGVCTTITYAQVTERDREETSSDSIENTEPLSDLLESDGSLEIAPIYLTGERVERTLQDTASSVSFIDQQQIKLLAGDSDIDTVLELTPNINIIGGNDVFTIRGVNAGGPLGGGAAFIGGNNARATIYLDGRPISVNELAYGNSQLWDVQSVEVYRGPQTTSRGANSIAGAIYINTNDPTFDYEVAGRGIYATEDTYDLAAMVNLPLVEEQVAVRFAFNYRDEGTFLNFTQPFTSDIGLDRSRDVTTSFRTKAIYLPKGIEGLELEAIYQYGRNRGPQTEVVFNPQNRQYQNGNPDYSMWDIETNAIIGNIAYEMDNGFTFSNSAMNTWINLERLTTPGQGNISQDANEFINETVIQYGGTDVPIFAQVGSYLTFYNADEGIDFGGSSTFTDEKEGIGVFGEVTWYATDKLSLTGGLRYQQNSQNRSGSTAFPPFQYSYDESFDALLPRFVVSYDITEVDTVGFLVSRGYNPGGGSLEFATFSFYTFDQETVWNYELFARTSWLDNRLLINANIFLGDFDDFQVPRTIITVGGPSQDIFNVGGAINYGAEIEASYAVTDSFSVFGNVGFLGTKITDFDATGAVVDIEGNQLPNAPSVTSGFGFAYEFLRGLTVSAQGNYVSRYYSDAENTASKKVASRVIFDAQLSYQYENWRIFAYSSNILDKFYITESLDPFAGNELAYVGSPREVGIGVEVSF